MRASQLTLQTTSNKVDHFSLTYADYAYKAGVWRLMDLMDELKITGSVSTNGLTGERHPKIVRALADHGCEIVGHAWAQDVTVKDEDPQTELDEMRKVMQRNRPNPEPAKGEEKKPEARGKGLEKP